MLRTTVVTRSRKLVAQAAQVASAQPEMVRSTLLDTNKTVKSIKIKVKIVFLTFRKNVISEPPRPQIELRIAVSHSL